MAKDTIVVDGVEYVRKQDVSKDKVIIRSRDSGVHFGELVSRAGSDEVTLRNARRIWYWDGAASLSELALRGTSKPSSCKFPEAVPEITVIGVCEIIPCTNDAAKSISGVKPWTQH